MKTFSLFRLMRCQLIFVLLVASLALQAQESIDLLTISGRQAVPSTYNDIPGEATESVLLANARLPLVFSDNTIWFNSLTYTFSQVNHRPAAEGAEIPQTRLHGVILQTGLVQRLDEKRAFQLLFVPRFMSDLQTPGQDAWQFGGIGLYEHRFNEKLRMRFGAMYNQEMSGPLLVPLIDIDLKLGSRWSIFGLLPIYGKVKYQASERFSTGLAYFGLITSYALSEPFAGNTYMERTSIDFTLFGRWRAFGNVHVEGRLGYALDRNYEQYRKSESIDLRVSILKIGDNRGEPLNTTFRDGPIAELRLVYSLPLPDSSK